MICKVKTIKHITDVSGERRSSPFTSEKDAPYAGESYEVAGAPYPVEGAAGSA